jgi:hypothetical protein
VIGVLKKLDQTSGLELASSTLGDPLNTATFLSLVGDHLIVLSPYDGTISSIDSTTLLPTQTTRLGDIGAAQPAAGGASLWVTASKTKELIELDSANLRILSRVTLPGRPISLWTNADKVVVVTAEPSAGVVSLAPRSLKLTTVPPSGGTPLAVAADTESGTMWILETTASDIAFRV